MTCTSGDTHWLTQLAAVKLHFNTHPACWYRSNEYGLNPVPIKSYQIHSNPIHKQNIIMRMMGCILLHCGFQPSSCRGLLLCEPTGGLQPLARAQVESDSFSCQSFEEAKQQDLSGDSFPYQTCFQVNMNNYKRCIIVR